MGARVWELVEELAADAIAMGSRVWELTADARESVLAFAREKPIKIAMGERVWEFVEGLAADAIAMGARVWELTADARVSVLAFARENLIKILPLAVLAVLLLALYRCCSSCCFSRACRKMMKAPGRKGVTMPRTPFERNPRAYFKDLRGRKE